MASSEKCSSLFRIVNWYKGRDKRKNSVCDQFRQYFLNRNDDDDESTHTIFSKHVHIKRLVEIEEEDTTHTAFQNIIHIRYLDGNRTPPHHIN